MEGFEDYQQLVASVARNVGRRFGAFATRDDFSQEAWCWILAHPAKIDEWLELGEHGRRKLSRALYHACNSAGQKAKAEQLGYRESDNFYYSLDMLKKVLPICFENGMDIDDPRYADFPDRSLWLDIINGISALPEHEFRLIDMVFNGDFGENRSDDEDEPGYEAVAALLNLDLPAARGRITRILRKMQRSLGGEASEPHLRRYAKSNAQAVAELRGQYDG